MKLFGRKGARPPARPPLARGGTARLLGDWPRGYEAQVRDGYCSNAIAQRAVRLVAEAVADAPLSSREPALLALIGGTASGHPLLGTIATHLLLHGNAFVPLLGSPGEPPTELFVLRPERVTVEPDARGWPAAYAYAIGSAVTRFPAEDAEGRPALVHIRAFNPLDDHYGMGSLGAASGAIAIHNAATRWNKALLDNAARPSGALVYDPGDGSALSPDQFERLRTELDASFAGTGNAGRPMLLEGGLKWQSLSLSPADMDFVGLKAAAAREIALAFGAPPMLLGLPGDATYANYKEANRALWRLTVLPLAGAVLDALCAALGSWFPDAQVTIDLDRVPALAEDRASLWQSVTAADFLSGDEKRRLVGLAVAGAPAEAQA